MNKAELCINEAEKLIVSESSREEFIGIVSAIGHLAIKGDRTARVYLIGLLSHSKGFYRRFAFYLLSSVRDLDPGQRAILEEFSSKKENLYSCLIAQRMVN